MTKKFKSWEELVNDGGQYGKTLEDLTPYQKIVYENIKDQKILKIQDAFAFIQGAEVTREHGIELAKLVAGFEPLRSIHTLIITHKFFHHRQSFRQTGLEAFKNI